MTIRLVDSGWGKEIANALRADTGELRVISPFIKSGALDRLLSKRSKSIHVITRFNLSDFAKGVSDISALRTLLEAGASVRGVKNLHAKLYLFGNSRAMVTSANLTKAALDRNYEFGLISSDDNIVAACRAYFEKLWKRGGLDLKLAQVEDWDGQVTRYLAGGAKPNAPTGLGDYGADAGIAEPPPVSPSPIVADASQAFVKFLGEGTNRVSLSFSTLDEVDRAGCHWSVAYPATKRPRSVRDGAIMFIARLTREPNDIRVFGRAIGMRHVPGRDDATQEDIERRTWKAEWPRYIRVHHAEFVAGTMANGVSLYEMMDALGSDSFMPTQRNAASGTGNTDPRKAYQQQAAVQLSPQGLAWLRDRLEAAFQMHGKVPADDLAKLDWPAFPPTES